MEEFRFGLVARRQPRKVFVREVHGEVRRDVQPNRRHLQTGFVDLLRRFRVNVDVPLTLRRVARGVEERRLIQPECAGNGNHFDNLILDVRGKAQRHSDIGHWCQTDQCNFARLLTDEVDNRIDGVGRVLRQLRIRQKGFALPVAPVGKRVVRDVAHQRARAAAVDRDVLASQHPHDAPRVAVGYVHGIIAVDRRHRLNVEIGVLNCHDDRR